MYFSSKKSGKIQEAKFSLIGITIGGILILAQCFTVVPAGTVGVVDFLGSVSNTTLKSGVNFVNPKAGIIFYPKIGDKIKKGDVIAEIFTDKKEKVDNVKQKLTAAIKITNKKVASAKLIKQILK